MPILHLLLEGQLLLEVLNFLGHVSLFLLDPLDNDVSLDHSGAHLAQVTIHGRQPAHLIDTVGAKHRGIALFGVPHGRVGGDARRRPAGGRVQAVREATDTLN